jgi:hypothetical protein
MPNTTGLPLAACGAPSGLDDDEAPEPLVVAAAELDPAGVLLALLELDELPHAASPALAARHAVNPARRRTVGLACIDLLLRRRIERRAPSDPNECF